MTSDLLAGQVVWATLDPVRGREQAGHRPVLVVSADEFHRAVTEMFVMVPITSRRRGWPNHVPVVGAELGLDSWAMTEQPRAISRSRITAAAGAVTPACLDEVRSWLRMFLEL